MFFCLCTISCVNCILSVCEYLDNYIIVVNDKIDKEECQTPIPRPTESKPGPRPRSRVLESQAPLYLYTTCSFMVLYKFF